MDDPSNAELDLEFDWTPVTELCRSQFNPDYFCHRQRGHGFQGRGEVHAAGYGQARLKWRDRGVDLPPEVC